MNYAYVATFTGNLISFVAGTTLTWSSPELSILNSTDTTPFDTLPTSEQLSWISSLLALGAVFGPFIYGFLADKVGRKMTLLICAVPYTVCYLMMAFGKSVGIFYAARFVSGLSLGGSFTVMPMYVGEISDDSNRGALGSVMNCFLCFGLLFSFSLGPYLSVMVFNLILAIFPCIFIVVFFLLAPESPHYFVSRGKHESAELTLRKIRGGTNGGVEKELAGIQAKIKDEGHATFFDIFKSKGLIKAFVISVTLVALQQLSGINAVLFFAQTIFEKAGTSLKPAICSILIGAVQFGTSFVTPLLCDRLGRKFLLLASAIGMIVSEVPLGVYGYLNDNGHNVESISFLPILCLITYIITYNSGFGPLPWAIMGELFPSNVKSAASSATAAVCWFFGFLIAKYFESMSVAIGMGPSFFIFAAFCVLAVPFCSFYVLETKGKTLQEIQEALNA